jgi:hypothetical protein
MSNDAYGNLGSEMKAMKDDRANLLAGIRDNRTRLRALTGQSLAAASQFLGETSKANERLAAQTRQMLSQADKDLKARTRQTLAEADQVVAAIRKDVAALKAEAGRLTADASGFLEQTSSENGKRRSQTRKMLAASRAESKGQARQVLAEAGKTVADTRTAVAGLKAETDRMLSEAAGMMKGLADTSSRRAAAWRGILHSLHGGNGGHPSISIAAGSTTAGARPGRKAAARRASSAAKKHTRKVA